MSAGQEREINLSELLGMNNRRPDFRLRAEDGVFVRSAVNTDLSDAHTAKRRPGYTAAIAGTDCRSLWIDEAGRAGYYADGTSIYRMTESGGSVARQLISGVSVAHGSPVAFETFGGEIVMSDGQAIFVMDRGDTTARPFGVPALSAVPSVSAALGGSLAAGYYMVGFAFQSTGIEISPLVIAPQVNVAAGGALAVNGLPTTWPASAAALLIYVSSTNATSLTVEMRLTSPVMSLNIANLTHAGARATTQYLAPLPPGRILRHYMGRLFSAAGTMLCRSEVYSPALFNPAKGYVDFPEPITVVEPCDGGLYVVSDATYWLAGDIETAEAKVVSPTRGIFGTSGQDRATKRAYWMTEKGIAFGDVNGNVTLPQIENVAFDKAAFGATLLREADGQRQLISSLFNPEATAAAARSYMSAEVIRKGTIL